MTGRSMVAHNEGFKSGERAGRLAAAEEIEQLRKALADLLRFCDEATPYEMEHPSAYSPYINAKSLLCHVGGQL